MESEDAIWAGLNPNSISQHACFVRVGLESLEFGLDVGSKELT